MFLIAKKGGSRGGDRERLGPVLLQVELRPSVCTCVVCVFSPWDSRAWACRSRDRSDADADR